MAREIDLDSVLLSPATVEAWHALARRIGETLKVFADEGRELLPIPDERARANDDGTLTIYVEIPGVVNISLDVPADQWSFMH
jgi:hypothetical protein